MLLQTSAAVAAYCDGLRDAPFVTVDTEFLFEKRYRPDLCLVQVGAPGQAAAIDPLVPDIDLAPLAALLGDPSILKVMHAGSQDVAIFHHRFGLVPAPVFDTQIVASVCGHGDRAGYARLCREVLDVEVDKTAQATDWSLRPLTAEQVDYALGDVTHLRDLYRVLSARLVELGREDWVAEEHAALLDPASFVVDPDQAWRRIRIRRPTPRTLALVGALAAWRERTAAHRNLPRGWVAHDDALVEIAEQIPRTPEALERVRRLNARTARGRDGKAILQVVERVLATPEDTWPTVPEERTLTSAQRALVYALQALLELRSAEHDVGSRLVASQSDLEGLVVGDDVPILKGWRAEVFGDGARALVDGELAITGGPQGAQTTVTRPG